MGYLSFHLPTMCLALTPQSHSTLQMEWRGLMDGYFYYKIIHTCEKSRRSVCKTDKLIKQIAGSQAYKTISQKLKGPPVSGDPLSFMTLRFKRYRADSFFFSFDIGSHYMSHIGLRFTSHPRMALNL